VTVYRCVQTFTPEFIYSARPARHATGDRWFVDETYVKVAGRPGDRPARSGHRRSVSERRTACAARALFARALTSGPVPVEVTTDRASVYSRVIDELARPRDMSVSSTRRTVWKLTTAQSPAAADARTQNDPGTPQDRDQQPNDHGPVI
jgi:transposase-like protein